MYGLSKIDISIEISAMGPQKAGGNSRCYCLLNFKTKCKFQTFYMKQNRIRKKWLVFTIDATELHADQLGHYPTSSQTPIKIPISILYP